MEGMMTYYQYIFYDLRGNAKKGIAYPPNTGGRPLQGSDIESVARLIERNFIDQIYVPMFEYWAKPRETIEREKTVSVSLWCDVDDSATNAVGQIGHPFSSRDQKRRNMSFTEYDDNGDAHTIQGDMCGYHADRNPFFNPKAKAIPPSTPVDETKVAVNVDKAAWNEYIQWLEERNGITGESE